MADTTTVLEVLDQIVDVLGGQSGQYETVVPVLQQIKELIASGITDPESIAEAVTAWLDEHPEATTTVQDGSITVMKLAQDVIELLDDKADIDGYYSQLTAGLAENLIGRGDAVPAEYLYRTAGGTADIEDGIATIDCIKGNTLVWNQLCDWFRATQTVSGVTFTNNGDGSVTLSGTATADAYLTAEPQVVNGHKYMSRGCPQGGSASTYYGYLTMRGFQPTVLDTGSGNFGVANQDGDARQIIYVKSGTVCDNVTFWPQLFDLTAIFGAGNEPATVEEFEAIFPLTYYPYSAPKLLPVDIRGIETVGFNLWDEEWELGTIDDSTGVNTPNSYLIRSKNYITAFPNTEYYARLSGYNAHFFCYGADYAYLGYVDRQGDGEFTTLANTKFMRFRMDTDYGTTYNHDICINLSWSGYRNGEYEEHWSAERPIDTSRFFPTGMKKVGDKADALYADHADMKVGVYTFTGSERVYLEDWRHVDGYYAFSIAFANIPNFTIASNNIRMAELDTLSYEVVFSGTAGISVAPPATPQLYGIFVRVPTSIASNTAQLLAWLAGKQLYYELATPTTTEINPPLNLSYKVSDFGTERIMVDETADAPQTAPVPMEVEYGINAIDTIRRLPTEYQSHKSMGQLAAALESSLGVDITETWDETEQRYEYEATPFELADNSIPDAKLAQTGGVLSAMEHFAKEVVHPSSEQIIEGWYINSTGGTSQSSNFVCTGFIDIYGCGGSTIVATSSVYGSNTGCAWFDKDYRLIGFACGDNATDYGGSSGTTALQELTIPVPTGTRYIRLTCAATEYVDETTFVIYKGYFNDAADLASYASAAEVETLSDAIGGVEYANLINPTEISTGKYVNASTGNLSDSATWAATGYMLLKAGTKYNFDNLYGNGFYAFYSAADRSLVASPDATVTVTQVGDNFKGIIEIGASDLYFRCSMQMSDYETAFVSSVYGEYKPYGIVSIRDSVSIDECAFDKVLIVGDSISAYNYGYYNKWVQVLIGDGFFKNDINNSSVHATGFVATLSGSGDDTFNVRLEAVTSPETYKLVVVFGGVNDYIQNVPFGASGDSYTANFVPAVDHFFAYLTEHFVNARIIVISPLRSSSVGTNTQGKYLTDYADYIRQVAKGYTLPILDLTDEGGFYPWVAAFSAAWTHQNDGLHPNADYSRDFLAPLIKRFIMRYQ